MDDRHGDEVPDETLIDHALELFVYAPLGFALEARTLLPRFVDRGRNQIALARVVGKFAVRKGREDVEAKLLEGQSQAVGLLRTVGLVPPDADHVDHVDRNDRDERPSATSHEAGEPPSTTGPSGGGAANDGPAPGDAVLAVVPPAPPAPDVPAVDVDALAIPGYDSLSASQVVPRLEGLTADELELVRCYEVGNRGRKTILAKIAQLQSA